MTEDSNTKNISVFIASPGDLVAERKQFRDAIHQLNMGFADGANVKFEGLGWEDTLASTGRRNQSIINSEIDRCDIFILVMHRRWGQEAPDAKPYSSYTEEEFHRALERWRKEKHPEIFVFFKRVDAEQEADAGIQLQKVLAFRKQLEDTRQVMYRYIDDSDQAFLNEIDKHLRAYVKGELSNIDTTRDIVVLPLLAIEEVNQAKKEAHLQTQLAIVASKEANAAYLKIKELQLEVAEEAADLAQEGFLERAREKFVKLISDTSDIRVLYLAYNFFKQTGDLGSALVVLKRWLVLSGTETKSPETATAYNNLGILYKIKGNLHRAKAMYEKSLDINEALGRKEGMASDYGNLGILYQTRGDLNKAETMYEKSLKIHQTLGVKEGMAVNYGNLGVLYQTKGDLERAEAMYEKSLPINKVLGRKEGIASDYSNLGNLYQLRGDFKQAEAMYQKSLGINEVLGRKEGIASDYGNLGNIYQIRSNLNKAEAMYEKSLEINQSLGRKEGIANQYGNLGILYKSRGDFEQAEAMYKKSLDINESLGREKSMENDYINLRNLYEIKGDFEQAEAMYKKLSS